MMNVNQGFKKEVQSPAKSLRQAVNGMKAQIAMALPKVMTPERFTRLVLTAISNNPKLANCSEQSFYGAMFQAAQLGLEPNSPTGQAYLIPYGKDVTFQIGYKGLIALAYRSGEIRDISAHAVYENDHFEYELGLEPKLVHKPALASRGAVIAYYAVYHTKSGGYGMEVMSAEDVKEFASKKSKAFTSGPWKTDFDAMAMKTVVKRMLKYAPISSDFVRAVAADDTVKNYRPVSGEAPNVLDDMNTIDAEYQVKGSRDKRAREEEEEIPMDWDKGNAEPHVDPITGEIAR